MKKNFKSFLSVLITIAFMASCAHRTPNPVSEYQYGDDKKSCPTIRAELSQIESEIKTKIGDQESKTGMNVALGITGWFLIVPWFFMDLSDAEKTEIEALRRRHNALVRISYEKNCGFEIKEIQAPKPQQEQKDTSEPKP